MRLKLLATLRSFCLLRTDIHTYNVKKANKITVTGDPFLSEPTEIIDVRSPEEYKLDHVPRAINLPVLSNDERDKVGKLYSSNSFDARKVGAKLVVSNIKDILENHILNKEKDYKPMVYCWRGGQRSRSLATVLSEIGFDVFVLEGGYKSYRKKVREELDVIPDKYQYNVITGLTGTGKSHILSKLSENGQQVLDLEELAKHKGSMLGRYPNEDQPSQKYFETLLLEQLKTFDPNQVVWMESESRKIGKVMIPNKLFDKLCHAKRYCVNLPLEERVKHIIRDYQYMIGDTQTLHGIIDFLERYHGKDQIQYWKSLIDNKDWETFVQSLLVDHYDPTYMLSQKKNQLTKEVVTMEISDLSEQSLCNIVNNLTMM